MKSTFGIIISAVLLMGIASCKNENAKETSDAKEVAGASGEAVTYTIDTIESLVNWKGYKTKLGIEDLHYGIVKIESGDFTAKGNSLESGTFEVDMNTLAATEYDINDEEQKETRGKLEGHLKNEDFMEVATFPEASFEITEVKAIEDENFNAEISGNFTIKGVKKNLSFKANTKSEGDSIFTFNTEDIYITRKDFNMLYDGMGESIIKDEFSIQVKIKGKKK